MRPLTVALLVAATAPFSLLACKQKNPPAPPAAVVPAVPPSTIASAAPPPQVDAGVVAPPAVSVALVFEMPPATAPSALPPTHDVVPAPAKPIAAPPNTFDPEGRLLARCDDASCDVWGRAEGDYRGKVARSATAGFRTSQGSMSKTSPDGRFALQKFGESGVAIVRVQGGAIVARAERKDATCREIGAWRGNEAAVAVPCGGRMLALDGARATAKWSEPLAGGAQLTDEAVFTGAQILAGAVAQAAPDNDAFVGANLFTWDIDKDGGSFPPRGTLNNAEWTFDPVKGCVFAAVQYCGCDCHEGFEVLGCASDDDGRHAVSASASESGASRDLVIGADGTSYAWLVETGHDHGSFHRLDVVSLGKDAATTWSSEMLSNASGSGVFLFPRAKRAAVYEGSMMTGDPDLAIFGSGSGPDHGEIPLGGDSAVEGKTALVASADAKVLMWAGEKGAILISAETKTVLSKWPEIGSPALSPQGKFVAGTRSEDPGVGRVEVRRVGGGVAWTSPEGQAAKLVGWLADAAKKNVLAVTLDDAAFEIDVATGARAPRAAIGPSDVAPARPTHEMKSFRPLGAHGLERIADGARMNLNDDRVYPQGTADRDAWSDLGEKTRFLIGNDPLRAPSVAREQLDGLFVSKGAFAKFLRGEPLPQAQAARASLPPVLGITPRADAADATGVTVRVVDPASAAIAFVEIDQGGRVERIAAKEKASTLARTLPPGAAVRACGGVGPICSPWTKL